MPKNNLTARIQAFRNTPRGAQINLWLAYFIYWAGAAAVMPYIAVYYETVGLKGSQIGQLNSIPFFMSMISSIILGFLSDVSRQHKKILRLCAASMIVVMALFPNAHTFLTFLPIVFMWSFINAPFNSILDQTTLNALENPADYGKIRVGGSIGWGIMVLVTGFLVDKLGQGYGIIFYINILFLILFLVNTLGMPHGRRVAADPENQPSLKKVVDMLRQPGMLPVLLMIAIWGVGEASITNFLFLHIKSLGGSSTLMGVALSISLVGEIVAFSLANKLQVKIGPVRMMLLSFVVLFTWLLGLSLIRNPNTIPFFQVFGGAGYALIQSGSVAYVNARAPKEVGTTAQAIRGGVLSGLGIGIGTLISGLIYETSGSVVLFRNMSILTLAGFVMGVVLYLNNQRRQKSKVE